MMATAWVAAVAVLTLVLGLPTDRAVVKDD